MQSSTVGIGSTRLLLLCSALLSLLTQPFLRAPNRPPSKPTSQATYCENLEGYTSLVKKMRPKGTDIYPTSTSEWTTDLQEATALWLQAQAMLRNQTGKVYYTLAQDLADATVFDPSVGEAAFVLDGCNCLRVAELYNVVRCAPLMLGSIQAAARRDDACYRKY